MDKQILLVHRIAVCLDGGQYGYKARLIAEDFHWIFGESPTHPLRCKAKIRYRQPEQPATAFVLADGMVEIIFDEPQRAITLRQAVVLYDGDIVLGGGVIQKVLS